MGARGGTRGRILREALRLFAERGYRDVTVGQIEAAAGLAPRRGGFYRHFASKESVLAETVEHHALELAAIGQDAASSPGDPEERLRRLAAWGLAFLRGQRLLLRVLAREGDRLPALRRTVLGRLVDPGYRLARREFARLRPRARPQEVRGVAAVALGALVHFVEDGQSFGVPPARASERAFVDAWVALLLAWSRRRAPRWHSRRR